MKLGTVGAVGWMVWLSLFSVIHGAAQVPSSEGNASVKVTVDARYPWVDSGLLVRKGERLSFNAEGTIQWGSKPDEVAGPQGYHAKAGKLGVAGLIGRVGYNGKPFPIGAAHTPIVMPKSGKLFLGINDFIFRDNAGAFVVTISKPPPA